jgi:hypothetical protein
MHYICNYAFVEEHMSYICRVGQNHIYTAYTQCFWQGHHKIYGRTQCTYTVLANPIQASKCVQKSNVGKHTIKLT